MNSNGGGGGGGVLFDDNGPSAGSVTAPSSVCGSQNGIGYGAGGGGGCVGAVSGTAGNGAPGIVYVEWD